MSDEWDGVCACGKAAMDGVRCRLGATHTVRCVEVIEDEEDYLA